MKYSLIISVVTLTVGLAGCGSASRHSTASITGPSQSGVQTATPPNPSSTPTSSFPPPSVAASASSSSVPSSPTVQTTAAPVVMGMAGALETNAGWPIKGAKTTQTGTPMVTEQFSRSGFIIDGVHWTWPTGDTHPQDYVVVPTVVGGRPYIIWAHLGAHTGGSDDVSRDPTEPATLWMTPWSAAGGPLVKYATLLTNDIPPVWSRTGQWNFSTHGSATTGQVPPVKVMAESAWVGWFHWGRVTTLYQPKLGASGQTPTVAWPSTLSPAYNGVVLTISTHLLGAAEGLSTNIYYLNLEHHTITGLASVSNGGGIFSSIAIWNGLVVDGEAREQVKTSTFSSNVVAYNEVTGQRQSLVWPDTAVSNFYDSEMIGNHFVNSEGATMATLRAPLSQLYGPTPNPF
ncbi:hypothetical protein [Sulfobacillus harzensis]|uniref:Uncharacterized protein n=1 Tax=Sulfobacillus harzensis TaxID=2729629 RepID=A0A7Y0L763_9FIRM|nr:hypothetical protein [Sulfobacillus harzensis]NMP23685.1 hypothetical protein [Sulfobacillus harzensis]